jgi:hypothetical protein
LVSAINNCAMLCRELGREAEAIAFDARARESEHLQDPIEVATDLEATAEHREDLGRAAEAAGLRSRAATIRLEIGTDAAPQRG